MDVLVGRWELTDKLMDEGKVRETLKDRKDTASFKQPPSK